MSVTGINTNDVYTTAASAVQEKTTAPEKNTTTAATETEKTTGNSAATTNTDKKTNSNSAAVYDKTKLSENDRKAIVSQLKAEQEKRQSQLVDLVKNMISKQSNTYGAANNIWGFLAKGDFTVDAATKAQAQKDISEDGYWGVKQTSERILSFASALAGSDSKNLEKMRDAFLKGYKQAEKTWGGELPDISKRTYDAVLEGFDKLMNPKTEAVTTSEDGTVVSK
ncbi:MAG: hypothetical protein K2N89_07695 [Lachnospiraceae bacterium]|nr:hypothetical protein [Lachnospiraceae bacterium]